MSVQHAYALDVEHGDNDGDGGPAYSWATVALGLARVLHRVRESAAHISQRR